MKYFLLSDNTDTLVGLRMAGVNGVVVHTKEEVSDALKDAFARDDIGLVLVTSKLMEANKELIFEYKLHTSLPLIVEMPDRHSEVNVASGIKKYIQEVVGIKI